VVGISVGNNLDHMAPSIERIKEVELERYIEASKKDLICDVFDKEEKEELEREEVDKLMLSSLCFEIMNETMDLGNAYPQDCNITPRHETSSSSKKERNQGVKARKRVQNERIFFGIVMGSKTQKVQVH
jgi:hypothetical protein